MNKSFFFFALLLFLAGAFFIGNNIYSNFKILSSPHDKAVAFYNSALKFYEAGDLKKCIVNLERAIEVEPTNKKVNILMGKTKLKENIPLEGVYFLNKAFNNVTKPEEEDIPVLYETAKLYIKNKAVQNNIHFKLRYEKALRLYKLVLAIRPNAEKALLGAGLSLYKLGKNREAVPYIKQIVEHSTNDIMKKHATILLNQITNNVK